MCGLAGFFNLDGAPADARVLAAMMRTVRHRGRDEQGAVMMSLRHGAVDGDTADTAIGFQRLKILDLSDNGHQPMLNPSRTIAIAFNGEIYNAFEYKPELEAAGCQFRSRTDTEVMLHLYERYGIDGMLERLNGMFAMAIADLRTRQLHVVRDHFGIKPLYWTRAGESVLFASEAKAFLPHPAFEAAVAEEHIDEQLAFRYVAGEATLLKGVEQLRPGHRLTIAPGSVTVTRYWSIADPIDAPSPPRDQAVDELNDLLNRSVASQLMSDVPVGCQLSGGIDSSLVTLLAQKHTAGPMAAFSIVFEDQKFSEQPWIHEAAAAACVQSWSATFTEDAFLQPLADATWHMDQPISHPNSLGLWRLGLLARDEVTVLLSGEGADEVFGGYARFRRAAETTPGAFVQATQFHPAAKLARLRPGATVERALARRLAIFNEGAGSPLSRCIKYEMQTFLVDLLVRQDKMTMAHGVENRVPFLDRRVVDFARHLPAEYLVDSTSSKTIVKDLARRVFNQSFVAREKAAFNLPLSQYFRSATFTALMEDSLLPGMKRRGWVNEAAVRELWRRSLSAPALTEPFWSPVALELWAQQFLDRKDYASA